MKGLQHTFDFLLNRQPKAALLCLPLYLFVVISFINSTTCTGGTLSGQVSVQAQRQQQSGTMQSRRGIYQRAGAPHIDATGSAYDRLAVVFLEGVHVPAIQPMKPDPVMDQKDMTFLPHILPITVGTQVQFPNSDKVYHNAFSLSKAKSFDLGRYVTGKSKSVLFDTPGIVQVFCEIHSSMSAVIHVFDHPYFQLIESKGSYRFENIPPGTYTVTVWHEFLPQQSKTVTITDTSRQEVNFEL